MNSFETIALAASVVMPLWNIPLIVKIVQRKSSDDLSRSWMLGWDAQQSRTVVFCVLVAGVLLLVLANR